MSERYNAIAIKLKNIIISMQFSVMYVKMLGVNNVLISVWDVRKEKHYTQETMQVYCLLMVHTCVGKPGLCVTAH